MALSLHRNRLAIQPETVSLSGNPLRLALDVARIVVLMPAVAVILVVTAVGYASISRERPEVNR